MPKRKSKRLSHEERAGRREKVAMAVKRGMTLAQAAKKFELSIIYVRECCHTFGVNWRKAKG